MAQQNGLPDLPSREESSSDEENNVHYCGVLLSVLPNKELPGEKLKQREGKKQQQRNKKKKRVRSSRPRF
ncbi:hypothetical protein MKW98_016149 [Papaver atlanticum]|uniref:Uncharacterized protein n=1 Tax=Papaver atlanticum TaxID=357466 RepID=A0AAD4X6L3_9MAGN|nr:hypothetical protein MKW98_016149 [Papaver atlanticum]